MARKTYKTCSSCGRKRDTSKTKFYKTPQGEFCEKCYQDEIYKVFIEYIGDELTKPQISGIVKVVTEDIGVLSNTHTKAFETGLRFVIKSAMFSAEEEISLRTLEDYLNETGNYKTPAEDVVEALLEANFLKETGKPYRYLPGEEAIEFANRIKYGANERETIRQAYGLLNYTLMKNPKRKNHSLIIKAILSIAQDILDKQKERGELVFEVHLSDILRHTKNVGLNTVSMTNHLDKWLGLTPDGDGSKPVFFDNVEYSMGHGWTPEDSFDIYYSMKKEWVQLRERLNDRMRIVSL